LATIVISLAGLGAFLAETQIGDAELGCLVSACSILQRKPCRQFILPVLRFSDELEDQIRRDCGSKIPKATNQQISLGPICLGETRKLRTFRSTKNRRKFKGEDCPQSPFRWRFGLFRAKGRSGLHGTAPRRPRTLYLELDNPCPQAPAQEPDRHLT
jgi:hypothetical protein